MQPLSSTGRMDLPSLLRGLSRFQQYLQPREHGDASSSAVRPIVWSEARLFRFVNDEREARGIRALQWDVYLARLAADWSKEMAKTGTFRHRDLSDALRHHLPRGNFQGLGENIFFADGDLAKPEAAHSSLMHSDTHRVNIVQPGFDRVGVGSYTDSQGRLWVTQNFGRSMKLLFIPMAVGVPPLHPIVHDY